MAAEYSMAVDFASGVVGGCSGIIVGQPFDTVRCPVCGSMYRSYCV